jgi:GrpB-like predicted nucleotidyltransferase (UPF0157 family)
MGDRTEIFADAHSTWTQLFAYHRETLGALLEPWLTSPPEHVGATAVPGLRGRPVMDVLITVADADAAPAAAARLTDAGWASAAAEVGFECTVVQTFDSPDVEIRAFVLPVDTEAARSMVEFRDVLRGNRSLRVEYDALREWLSVRKDSTCTAYSAANAKGAFVHQALRQSGLDSLPRPRIPVATR